jgi:phage terminase Nu1 subunit (DNA packaging protein)
MDKTLEEMKRGGAIIVLSCAMAALVWLAPVSAYPNTSKGELVAAALDAVILPLVDMVGKVPLIVALGMVAALGAGHALGLRLPRPSAPAFPPLPERPAPDEDIDTPVAPLARRRGLAAMAELRDAEAESTVPRKPQTIALEAQARAVMGDDFTLTDEIADRAMSLAAEWQRRGTPHGQRVDPIAIIRKARDKDRDWSNDRSWFGGLPKLGGQAWPRGKDGLPLPFVAQLDLAEIAAANPDTPLPREGSLAFFINEGAVLHVPPGDHQPTPAPDDLPHAYEEDGYPLPEVRSPLTQSLFPFWPVEPARMRLPEDLPPVSEDEDDLEIIDAAQVAASAAITPRREYAFSTGGRLTEGIAGAETMWWYGAGLVLRQLQAALAYVPRAIAGRESSIAKGKEYQARLLAAPELDEKALADSRAWEERNRADIPKIEAEGRGLAEFAARFETFVAGRDPWSEMTAEEAALLKDVMETARRDFEQLCRFHVSLSLRDVRNATIRRMITGDQRAAAAIPDAVLALLNEQYRLPTSWQHQMFGLGGCRQTNRYDHMCDHLLLQIVYDDLPEFRFGDMGLYQFWISPENLAAGRWDKVQLTFECG